MSEERHKNPVLQWPFRSLLHWFEEIQITCSSLIFTLSYKSTIHHIDLESKKYLIDIESQRRRRKERKMSLPPLPAARTHSADKRAKILELQSENPFKLPGDDQIFRMREDERRSKEHGRSNTGTMKIWEKTKTEVGSTSERLRDILGDQQVLKVSDVKNATQDQGKINIPRRQEKENTQDFVAKKREMFLVQMSLNTKREEIRKLEEEAQMKEEALQRSEQMLEEDAMRFDAFLKENDKKAHDAIKRAEEETKKKQEKTQEIKRLTQQIQALSSEMSKHREALEDCMRYKNFLDMLTPPEWFDQHRMRREEKIRNLRQEAFDAKLKEWERVKRRLIEQHRKEAEARKEAKKAQRRTNRSAAPDDDDDEDEQENKLVIPPPPRLEDEVVELPEEEVPMYFSEPQQLMDIFSALEEQNLFLIQNSQETEHTLEELQHSFTDTKIKMEAQTNVLQQQIDELQNQIGSEEGRVKSLLNKRMANIEGNGGSTTSLEKTSKNSGNTLAAASNVQSQVEKEKLLGDLNGKVRNVYELCGFDASSKPSTLFMLSQMESKLEVLLQDIERMPADYVIKAEKEKEKRRRERKREEQQALQVRLQEERNRRAIERSMQAPKKRVGRQVMYRSKPLRTEEANTNDDNGDKDNTDEIKYLS